jgi:hypothetical protein
LDSFPISFQYKAGDYFFEGFEHEWQPVLDGLLELVHVSVSWSQLWRWARGKPIGAGLIKPLEDVQRKCLLCITGGYKKTPLAALEREALRPMKCERREIAELVSIIFDRQNCSIATCEIENSHNAKQDCATPV